MLIGLKAYSTFNLGSSCPEIVDFKVTRKATRFFNSGTFVEKELPSVEYSRVKALCESSFITGSLVNSTYLSPSSVWFVNV